MDELQRDGWEIGDQVGTSDDGEALFTVRFVRDGQVWATCLTREEARMESSIDWDGTPGEFVREFHVEPTSVDYGMRDADFI